MRSGKLYPDLRDAVDVIALMSAREFDDLRSEAERPGSALSPMDVVRYAKSSACQFFPYPSGLIAEYNPLLRAINSLGVQFPTVKMARHVFDTLQPRQYSFEAEGDLWWIRSRLKPQFETPFNHEEWVIGDVPSGQFVRLNRSDLPNVFDLFARLNGRHHDVRSLAAALEEKPRMLLDLMRTERRIRARPPVSRRSCLPELLFLGHSSLMFRTERHSFVTDPCVGDLANSHTDPDRNIYAILNDADAILISHSHWDHMPWTTLACIRRDMQLYVPKVSRPTVMNAPVKPYLDFMGFSRVQEVEPGETLHAGDITIETFPFHGEPFGVDSRFDGLTYLVTFGGKRAFATVDTCFDEDHDMRHVIEDVAGRGPLDVLLFGSSGLGYAGTSHSPAASAGKRYLSNELSRRPELMRYHPTVVDVEGWADVLQPKLMIPFAQFIFDGCERTDVTLRSSKRVARAFDDYWADFAAGLFDGGGADALARWRDQLRSLAITVNAPLVPLHPMQGVRF